MTTARLREIAFAVEQQMPDWTIANELRAHADELDGVRDEALEEAAMVAEKVWNDTRYWTASVRKFDNPIAAEIRALKSKPAPHANAIQPAKDANAH